MELFKRTSKLVIVAILALSLNANHVLGAASEDHEREEIEAATGEPTFPDIWTVIEDSYDTDILMTLPETYPNGVSMFVEELYEVRRAIGVVKVTDHGQFSRYNYYTASNQMYYVKNMECLVGGLVDYPGYKFYGWTYNMQQGSMDQFVFGPSALFRAARDNTPKYVSSDVVRSIPCDQFKMQLPDNYNVTFSFSTDDWTMPYGHTMQGKEFRAPIQVKVTGLQQDPWDLEAGEKMLTIYYDYIIFNPYAPPEDHKDFLVERGVDCKNRETLDPNKIDPPFLPNSFKVHMEFIVHDNLMQFVYRSWMYYDERRRMIRFDLESRAMSQMTRYKRHIYDYSTGISYNIDDSTGKCEMKAIQPGTFGSEGILGGVLMSDPDHIFHIDDSLIFSGYSETRGLLTQLWTATRNDITNSKGETYEKVVIDYQFLRDDVADTGDPDMYKLLVRMDMTVYKNNDLSVVDYQEAINFLHFVAHDKDFLIDEFDVRECYPLPQQRSWLKIKFEGIWKEGLDKHIFNFQKDVIRSFHDGNGVSYIRMPEIQVDHDEDYVWAIMLLLQPAPYVLEFVKQEPTKPRVDSKQMKESINDVNICAGYCLLTKDFECHSFYECQGQGRNCFLSEKDNATGDVLLDLECDYFIKTMMFTHSPQQPNIGVESWLEAQIVERRMVFSYPYTDQNNQTQHGNYTAIGYIRELLADDPLFVDYLREDFQPLFYGARFLGDYTDLKVDARSYAKCLEICAFYEAFRCETFSYCYNSAKCYLSSTIFVKPMLSSEVLYQADCNIIGRQLIDDYTHVEGAILAAEVNQKVEDILDPNYCAYLCDEAVDFVCRSFDYCMDIDTCLLHDTHSLDAGDGALQFNNSQCTHYSRDFLVDFEKHENVKVTGTRDVLIKNIKVEECARECVNVPGMECNGFDYCLEGDVNNCFLTQYSYSGDGMVITDTITCDHYKRIYYEGDDINHLVNKERHMYGPGDMAGLATGVLVSTIILSFVAFYLYNR